MDLTGGGGAWNSQPYVKPFCLSSTLQPTAEFSQRGSCVLSHSLRNSGVRLAACGLPDVARVLLACHRVNAIAHRLRAVAGTHISAARNQRNSSRPQPVRRFRGVTFAVVAHFVVARDHFWSSLLTAAARSPVVMGGVVPLPLLFARRNSVRIVRHTVPRYPRLPAFSRKVARRANRLLHHDAVAPSRRQRSSSSTLLLCVSRTRAASSPFIDHVWSLAVKGYE